jgi:hypothetical protein
MKKILLLLTIIFLLGNISCIRERRCERHTQCPTAPLILDYFGNYKPGNYWIYENQDGTKRDSVYVTEYSVIEFKTIESATKEQSDCIKYPVYRFSLHSKYLYDSVGKYNCIIDNEYTCDRTSMRCESKNKIAIFHIESRGNNDFIERVIKLYKFNTHINSTVLYDTGFIYPDTLTLEPSIRATTPIKLFATRVGLVEFITTDLRDTFSLIKYYIQ